MKSTFLSFITLPRSGSHYLANIASTKINSAILTTNLENGTNISFTEYAPKAIKRGNRKPNSYIKNQGFRTITLMSHPHHFSSIDSYLEYIGDEKANLVISFPFDSVYSLYVAYAKGYKDTPTSVNKGIADYEQMKPEHFDVFHSYKREVEFINSIQDNMHKINFFRYEDFNDEKLSKMFDTRLSDCDFEPDKNRIYWSNDFEKMSPEVITKIYSDYHILLKNFYPEKLDDIPFS